MIHSDKYKKPGGNHHWTYISHIKKKNKQAKTHLSSIWFYLSRMQKADTWKKIKYECLGGLVD